MILRIPSQKGKPNLTKYFVVDEVRVGVYGLGVELKGLVTKENYRETKYLDPIELAIDMEISSRKNEKCDIIICLSHLGYQYRTDKVCDITIAKRTYNTDLIIGGHTHTFLGEPTMSKQKQPRDSCQSSRVLSESIQAVLTSIWTIRYQQCTQILV